MPRKSVVRLTDRPDMTLDVYRGRKTTKQNKNKNFQNSYNSPPNIVKRAEHNLTPSAIVKQ